MIVVFAGAGASKAVSPSEYPTTVEFFNKLPEEISNDILFRRTVEYLKSQRRHISIVDIEHVLWALEELRAFLRQASDGSTVPGWFLRGRLLEPINQNSDFGNLVNGGGSVLTVADQLVGRIDQMVYQWYSREPAVSELEASWLPLLAALESRGHRLEAVTTNYDIVLESAIAASSSTIVDTGRRGVVQPHLDLQLWRDAATQLTPSKGPGLLTKLHGSVDWSRGNERIFVGDPTFKGSHDRHVIIYPGFKGVPDQEPFATLHHYFELITAQASAFIFVGFAFRDDYINEVLRRSASSARVVIVNPSDLPPSTLPFRSEQYVHIAKPFGASLVQEIVDELPF